MRQVIIYPGEDEFWIAECPSLPGCVSQGKSREEAITNIREAIEGYRRRSERRRPPDPGRALLRRWTASRSPFLAI